jgi:serine protease Do
MPNKNKLIIFFTIFNLFFFAPNLAKAFKSKDLENFQTDLNQLIEEILPQNVTILAQKKLAESEEIFAQENQNQTYSIGSGFLISQDGLIATNYHVVENSNSINVGDFEGEKYAAKLIAFDEKSDLAILKIDSEKNFEFVEFADSSNANLGDLIILVGNPFDLGISVARGIISAKNRIVKEANNYQVLQIDAAINKGNSGGAIFNIEGKLIGVASAIFSPTQSSSGIGFALPSNLVKKITSDLKETGEVNRGWIGISIQELNSEIIKNFKINRGIFVTEVAENSPSEEAQIQAGDIILKFNDKEIKNINQFSRLVENYQINKTAKINIWREGKEKTLEIKILRNKNDLEKFSFSQFKLVAEKNQIKISTILENSAAFEKGLKIGDTLLTIDGNEIKTIAQAQKLISQAIKENRKILMVIGRQNKKHALTLSVK